MKISLIGPVFPYRGGIAHFTTLLAKKLIDAGHDVQMVSFKKQYPVWLYPGKSDKDYSPGREKVDANYLLSPLNPLTWRKTIKAISYFQPQQVVLPWWVTFWGPAFRFIITRLKRRGIPVTVLIHNTLPHEARALDRFLAKRVLQMADRYIVMTEKEKGRLRTLLPEAKEIEIIPHPIYRMFKPSSFSKDEIRSRLGLPANKLVILFFGFVRPYKGLSDLIKALKIIHTKEYDVHLLVAGEFWESRAPYDLLIESLELQDYVHIFDRYVPDNEAAQFFEAADIFAAPYTGGTQSGALKSALGFGLPVVVSDIVADGLVRNLPDCCKVVLSENPALLADAIIHQLSVPIMDNDMVQKLFNLSWEVLILMLGQNFNIFH